MVTKQNKKRANLHCALMGNKKIIKFYQGRPIVSTHCLISLFSSECILWGEFYVTLNLLCLDKSNIHTSISSVPKILSCLRTLT